MRASRPILGISAALCLALAALPLQAGGQTGGWSIIGGSSNGDRHSGKGREGRYDRGGYDSDPFSGYRVPRSSPYRGGWGDASPDRHGERCGGGDPRDRSRERGRR